ncbi:MAG: NADH-quinone oxidoreductase subunit D [Cyanobacteria bacterium SIG31]|nr:NADH-quinone oxidoreductase subunit D [Cyanobacteria bacterium SIG31]
MSKLKINLGPQHPSTHGVLRLILELEGEKILSCEPDVGYLHRGMEKIAEKLSYIQYLPMVDRMDYLAGFFYSELLCRTVEKAHNVELSARVRAIRVMLLELNRIASHLLWIGAFLMDLGATSPFFYAFREREQILQYFEKISGQRMMNNYFVFGGVRRDVFDLEDVESILNLLPQKVKDYERIITENPIFLQRTKGKGVLTPQVAINNGITGVNLRASGVDLDLRLKDNLYCGFYVQPVVLNGKDAWSRYKARILEIIESVSIAKQALEYLKKDEDLEQNLINPLSLKLPKGEYYSEIEAPRGIASIYVNSDGGLSPYRLKWRTGSYYAVNLLRKLLVGTYLNDAIAIAGSLDIILPEVDK